MKRKIALLLALAMTASMLPVNAFANSTNEVSRVVSVKDEDVIENAYLKITPRQRVEAGDSIVLTFTNAEVLSGSALAAKSYENLQGGKASNSFDALMSKYRNVLAGGSSADQSAYSVLSELWKGGTDDAYIPWKLTRNGRSQVTVDLFPVPTNLANNKFDYNVLNDPTPYYYIPLAVAADGEGDITVAIDSNETSISDGTLTFARTTSGTGATTTTVDDVLDFNESLAFNEANGNQIRIEETVAGTFEAGTLTIRINGGFQFASSNVTVTPGKNTPVFTTGDIKVDDNKITIEFTKFNETKKASAIVISGIVVEPEDEDDNWGAVDLSFRGIGMTSETITVANRADYGMSLSLNEEATSILTGFSYPLDGDLDEDDFATAEVHVEETIADTWNAKQKLYFQVPEDVKIIDFEINDTKYMSEDVFTNAYLTDEGSTLVVPRLADDKEINDDQCSEFDIVFYLTICPEFGDNDITLSMYGAGVEEGAINDVVIAKAVTPISVATESTKTNIGYSSIATADITITENVAGAILDDKDVELSIDTLWTSGDIGFYDNDTTAVASGELEIGTIKVSSGLIRIPVEAMSYNTPGTITVSNIAVGTTRSVPMGDYDLTVQGDAVINNYDDDYDANYKTTTVCKDGQAIDKANDVNDAERFVYTQGDVDSYTFAKYLSVGTPTGTLDTQVSVTIGETTITVDGEAYTMDVAPYIQASSNSTMVPLRFVTLALGVDEDAVANGSTDETSTITWDANTKTATIFYALGSGQKIIQFTAGSNTMVVDGTSVPMSYGVIAEITDSRMFVPFRALGTALGVDVQWDETTRTATYN